MANKILLKRGDKSKLPALTQGEPAFVTDTRELYIGTGSGNVNIGGSMWYKGTDMSGTSATTGAYNYSACPLVKVGDTYLNTSNGNIYECTTAGSGTSAKWTYKGCLKGPQGESGSSDALPAGFKIRNLAEFDGFSCNSGEIRLSGAYPQVGSLYYFYNSYNFAVNFICDVDSLAWKSGGVAIQPGQLALVYFVKNPEYGNNYYDSTAGEARIMVL